MSAIQFWMVQAWILMLIGVVAFVCAWKGRKGDNNERRI